MSIPPGCRIQSEEALRSEYDEGRFARKQSRAWLVMHTNSAGFGLGRDTKRVFASDTPKKQTVEHHDKDSKPQLPSPFSGSGGESNLTRRQDGRLQTRRPPKPRMRMSRRHTMPQYGIPSRRYQQGSIPAQVWWQTSADFHLGRHGGQGDPGTGQNDRG